MLRTNQALLPSGSILMNWLQASSSPIKYFDGDGTLAANAYIMILNVHLDNHGSLHSHSSETDRL